MRVTKLEIENLKKSILYFDKKAKIYLFGSRANVEEKGGDIDILIVSENISRAEKRKIRLNFFQEFGEQKLDILIEKDQRNFSNFTKEILEKAIEL